MGESIGDGKDGFAGMRNPHRNNEQAAADSGKVTDAQRQFNEQTRKELQQRTIQYEKAQYDALVDQLNKPPVSEQEKPKGLLGLLRGKRG